MRPIETSFCGIAVPGRPLLPFSSIAGRPLVLDEPLRTETATLLAQQCMISSISPHETDVLLEYMHPFCIPAGETFMHEGAVGHNDHSLFIIRGNVLLASMLGDEGESIPTGILGAGHWLGDIAQPNTTVTRLISCSVSDTQDLLCLIITRDQLLDLFSTHSALAAKLILLMGHSASCILRELHQKMVRFIQINNMHQLHRAMDFAKTAQKMLQANKQKAAEQAAQNTSGHTTENTEQNPPQSLSHHTSGTFSGNSSSENLQASALPPQPQTTSTTAPVPGSHST